MGQEPELQGFVILGLKSGQERSPHTFVLNFRDH